MVQLNSAINVLNLNIKRRKTTIKLFYYSKSYIQIILILHKIGLIKFCRIISKRSLVINFNFINNIFFYNKITNISTTSKKVFINVKYLSLLLRSNYNHNLYVLTDLGIISIQEAVQKRIGGKVLFSFF